ncbi:MAG: oxygen-independent coproporphyrinogen III oxidase [Bacteroidota bacterium]
MQIPDKLLDKYNQPVPRYTSYPPANFFQEDFGEKDFIDAMIRSNDDDPRNVSIYIHIPFCNKICHYCGCNSIKIMNAETTRDYMDALKTELGIFRKNIDKNRKVSQVHWGGGTPNSLPAEMIEEIMNFLNHEFEFILNPEIAIECNPAGLTNKYIEVLDRSGFNRISLGIQDFSQKVLDAVNRDFPERPVEEIVNYIRAKNIRVNMDFIYGLPYQDEKKFAETIKKAVEISPDRLVTFSYAHVPWVKGAQKLLEKHGLPDPETKSRMFEAAAEILHNAGYRSIGLDHYAKEDDELYTSLQNLTLHRNFQGYCTRNTTGQVYAAGISSISQLHSAYSQNTKKVSEYISALSENHLPVQKGYYLNKQEVVIRRVINEIMCNFYIHLGETASDMGLNIEELKKITGLDEDKLREFEEDGLLNYERDKVFIKEYGKFFIRNIASLFDPLQKTDKTRKFSKSV